jgi:aspartyl-tRNA(Asn)/glutamyl-tRNA(Gln) amidotransferase subunit A
VAAAFRMGCLHLGTDGGGSIRIPAGFSGTFGFKPTFGQVPAYPLSPFGTIAHLGPLTADVADAARMLTVMSGPDQRDWYALADMQRDFSTSLDAGVAGLRIALSVTFGYVQVDAEIAKLVERAAQALTEVGAIVELRDPGFASPFDTFKTHWYTGAANLLRSISAEKRQYLEPGLSAIAKEGERIPHMDYIAATNQRAALGHHMNVFHTSYDVLLTPTLPIPAFEVNRIAPKGTDQSNWMHWTLSVIRST